MSHETLRMIVRSLADVASNFFGMLGARPIVGRLFVPSDETSD